MQESDQDLKPVWMSNDGEERAQGNFRFLSLRFSTLDLGSPLAFLPALVMEMFRVFP